MPPKKKRKQTRSDYDGYVDLELDKLPAPPSETDSSQPPAVLDKRRTRVNQESQETTSAPKAKSTEKSTGRLQRIAGTGLSSFNAMLPAPKDAPPKRNTQRALTGSRAALPGLRDDIPPILARVKPSGLFGTVAMAPRKSAPRYNSPPEQTMARTRHVQDPSVEQLQREMQHLEATQSATSRLQHRGAMRRVDERSRRVGQVFNGVRRSMRANSRVEPESATDINSSRLINNRVGSQHGELEEDENKAESPPQRRRGRPPKQSLNDEPTAGTLRKQAQATKDVTVDQATTGQPSPLRRRGRPPKQQPGDESTAPPPQPPPRKRTRLSAHLQNNNPTAATSEKKHEATRTRSTKQRRLLTIDPADVVFAEDAAPYDVDDDQVTKHQEAKQDHVEEGEPEEEKTASVDEEGELDVGEREGEDKSEDEAGGAHGMDLKDASRLWGQWGGFKKIIKALKQVGVTKVKGKTIRPARSMCRDAKVLEALRPIQELTAKLRAGRDGPSESAPEIDVAELLDHIEPPVAALYKAVDPEKRKETQLSVEVYSFLFPNLVRLIKDMVLFFEFLDGDDDLATSQVEQIIRLMRVIDDLYEGSRAYMKPQVAIVTSVRHGICVRLRPIRQYLSAEMTKRKTDRRRAREAERVQKVQRAAFLQQQREQEVTASIIARCREWHDLHRERLWVEGALHANPPWKNMHLAHDKMHPEVDANGTEIERVEMFERRIGPHPDRVVAARAMQWAPVEDDMFLNSLRQYRGDLVKVMRAHCRGRYPGPVGILNAYNVTELVVRAADLREWLMREQIRGYGFVEDWLTTTPCWVKGKMPQIVLGRRVDLDNEEIDPL